MAGEGCEGSTAGRLRKTKPRETRACRGGFAGGHVRPPTRGRGAAQGSSEARSCFGLRCMMGAIVRRLERRCNRRGYFGFSRNVARSWLAQRALVDLEVAFGEAAEDDLLEAGQALEGLPHCPDGDLCRGL